MKKCVPTNSTISHVLQITVPRCFLRIENFEALCIVKVAGEKVELKLSLLAVGKSFKLFMQNMNYSIYFLEIPLGVLIFKNFCFTEKKT